MGFVAATGKIAPHKPKKTVAILEKDSVCAYSNGPRRGVPHGTAGVVRGDVR